MPRAHRDIDPFPLHRQRPREQALKTHDDSSTHRNPPFMPGGAHPEVTPCDNDELDVTSAGLRDASDTPVREVFWRANCGRFNVTAVLGVCANA